MYSALQTVNSSKQDPTLGAALVNASDTARRICQRIKLQIPQKYAQEPVISNLIRCYEIEVNIRSALLATNAQESGWFDLELCGMPDQIQKALGYLAELDVEIWDSDRKPQTDWTFN